MKEAHSSVGHTVIQIITRGKFLYSFRPEYPANKTKITSQLISKYLRFESLRKFLIFIKALCNSFHKYK
jgi:hypothetical protein